MDSTTAAEGSGAQQATQDAQAALMRLAGGYRLSQMLYVAAKLGIADLLREGPRSCDELARLTDTHAPSLYRALRALASIGVFAEVGDRCFALTPLAELLRTDVSGSLRAYVTMQGEDWIWHPRGESLHSIRTGEPAFDHVHGASFFAYLARNPAAAGFRPTRVIPTPSPVSVVEGVRD